MDYSLLTRAELNAALDAYRQAALAGGDYSANINALQAELNKRNTHLALMIGLAAGAYILWS